ncbi:MAG: complex I subunit 4 family protein [Myxococcota bacterium]
MGSIIDLWPAVLAGACGAFVPRRPSWGERAGIGLIAALLVLFLMWMWPTAAGALEETPAEWPHLLNLLIGLPLVGAFFILFMPRQSPRFLKGLTLGILLVDLVASLWLLRVPMNTGWHFVYVQDWIPSLGIRYHVAVDGISLWLVMLTTFITPIAAYVTFGSLKTRIKDLCFSFLFLQAAMIGAFVALDLFLFYVFWELMLIPMYLMIGVWGSHDRIKAAVKFFLYTMAGSMLMLAAILYLVYSYTQLTGTPSFDLLALNKVLLPKSVQLWCFWGFAIAFFIKVPMFPVHTWLPDAHVQAPTGGSIILAAVLLKMGTYAYMRFAMGLFPWAAGSQAANLAGIAVLGGIVYGALCSWKQDDFKRLIAYSSVAHLGYVMLGLFANTHSSTQGALLQMVNHGISTGALFLLVGVIYDRRHTREIKEFGGLAKVMPVYAAVFIIVTMASVGVPGTNGFVGEFLVIMGTYTSPYLGKFAGVDAVLAAFGVILAAIYMLSVVQKVFFGPLKNPKNFKLPDLTTRETVALAPLVIMIFVIGFFPSTFLSRSSQAVSDFHTRNRLVWNEAQGLPEGEMKLLTNDVLAGNLTGGAREALMKTLSKLDEGAPTTGAADKEESK